LKFDLYFSSQEVLECTKELSMWIDTNLKLETLSNPPLMRQSPTDAMVEKIQVKVD